MTTLQVLHGDCREQLRAIPDRTVQTIVTSPPYYGLRRYTDDPREIGQEATPAAYVAALVDVFRECRRVLRDDGTLWLNLGDSYAGGHGPSTNPGKYGQARDRHERTGTMRYIPDVAEKNLLGIPWRVAFALQDDGWILRSDIVWNKPNCMPESVQDRPTRAHEYLFLFAKSPRYYYDAAAIAEASITNDIRRPYTSKGAWDLDGRSEEKRHGGKPRESPDAGTVRNRRTVWTIPTQPYKGAHYATMPEALIAPCILAGSRPDDIVLDPFGGSGTVGRVALRLQRSAILVELNGDYIDKHITTRTNGVQVEMML